MKLRNKKTGEVCEFMIHKRIEDSEDGNPVYAPFTGSIEDWKDYEEPKGIQGYMTQDEDVIIRMGSTKEAEKAVEKLKAWTRLKDEGARFKGWFWDKCYGTCIIIGDSEYDYIDDRDDQIKKDLDLLFGGEDA